MTRNESHGLLAADVARAAVSYDEVRVAQGAVWWLESRPDEDGRSVVVRWDAATGGREVVPAGVDVGSRIHAYGGGVFAATPGGVWWVNRSDGSVCRSVDGTAPEVMSGQRDSATSYGDLTAAAGEVAAVRETPGGDELVLFRDGADEPMALVRSGGFLAAPRLCRGRIAWLSWAADRMPWDATELWVAPAVEGRVGPAWLVAGGADESVVEPVWQADGSLTFLSDRTGWWNLYRWDGEAVSAVAPMAAEVCPAPWELGYASYVPLGGGRVAMTVHEGARQSLAVVDRSGGVRRVALPYTSIKPYLAAVDETVIMVASSPGTPPQVVSVDLRRDGVHTVLSGSGSEQSAPAPSGGPELIEVCRPGVPAVTALVYPPDGAGVGWCAPLVVRAHPGPTASAQIRLDPHRRFLTSHGFAVVDVDYRGSTGYGRAFRRSLYGRWGSADVADCRAVADALLNSARARPGQVFISGASAGGYTALHAVSAVGPFDGAVARSAIVDPGRWQMTAPRWQRPHAAALRGLAGPVVADAVRRPVLLIHSVDDHVAPVEDIEALFAQLRRRDPGHRLLLLGGAGHQFTASEATAAALDEELRFYRDVLARA